MKQITLLIKPASSNCNLRCSYCFYNDVSEHREQKSYPMMSKETTIKLITRTVDSVDDDGIITFSFQGGEPTLAGIAYFQFFVNMVNTHKKQQTIQYCLQTNGTTMNDQWGIFFHEHNFLVGVSLDGYSQNMDLFRYDIKRNSVFQKVLRCTKLLEKHQVEYNILTVVSKQLSKEPEKLYDFYQKNHFKYVQLIPCLPSLEEGKEIDKETALTPKDYANFFIRFHDCWKKDVQTTKYIDINIFSNVYGLLQGQAPYQCGMLGRCFLQFVIEGDGSVFPCDFYVLDDLKMGNLNDDSFLSMLQSSNANKFLKDTNPQKEPCTTCRFINICKGGCKRQNICYLDDHYCGYQALLEHIVTSRG
ncbi:radical SAM/SPASM domain-containing protein [Tannockella kyphosi]|uniref:radical SAM/SPASM domain-containing protein n=1 Tax=Tannockella kyphosi TaxID=2899121 RepID=UPI002012FC5F|nr:radical SAM protein [Tannockella kyphosi]